MLFFIRHAHAEKFIPTTKSEDLVVGDFWRPLSAKGHHQLIPWRLKILELLPKQYLWLSSPRLRCVETADILAGHLTQTPMIQDCLDLDYPANLAKEEIDQLLRKHPCLVLVGHHPNLENMIQSYLGHSLHFKIPKAGMAQLQRKGNQWYLRRLWRSGDL